MINLKVLIFSLSFITFLLGMTLFFLQSLKWGGSALVFSFVLNLYSIYQSLTEHHEDDDMTDEEKQLKDQRDFRVIFKLVLFILEIIAFNYLLFLLRIPLI